MTKYPTLPASDFEWWPIESIFVSSPVSFIPVSFCFPNIRFSPPQELHGLRPTLPCPKQKLHSNPSNLPVPSQKSQPSSASKVLTISPSKFLKIIVSISISV